MSFLCQTPEPTPAPPATQTVVQQADPLFRDAFNRVMNRADVVAGKPYQPYGGQRIAGLTPDTQASFGITRQNVGAYQPFVGLAGTQAAQAGLSLPQRNVGDYMNPYIQNVVDIAKREAIRGDAIAGQGRNFAARQANAFGGSRHGIVEAEAQRNLGQRLDDIQTQGLAAGYDKAMTAIDREAQNQVRSAAVLGDLGSRASQLGFADATALDAVGTRQQQQEQANLDLAYKDFLAQRDYERDQVRFLSDIMNRAPQSAQMSARQSETSQFTPQASPISQAAGLATAGLGAYGLYNWLFKAGGGEIKKYADGGNVKGYQVGGLTLADISDEDLAARIKTIGPSRASALAAQERDPAQRARVQRAVEAEFGRIEQQELGGIPSATRRFLEGPHRAAVRGLTALGEAASAAARRPAPANELTGMRPDESIPEPPALVPERPGIDMESRRPGPGMGAVERERAPTGTTNISAIPPEITLGGMAPTRPTFQAPAAPSLANIRMPQAPGEVDYTQQLNQTLGNLPTAAQARERVAETKFDPVKDPNEGLPRWVMPVLRAGLSMMQAKPGQSALAGIGAGAEAGMTQAMQDREEGRKIEAENQRRRERAQDLTERARDRAAQDASTVRNEAFQAGRMAMDQGRMSFDRYKAALDIALAEKRLTLEQHRAALDGARLGLEARRTETAERQSDAYTALTQRQAAVQGRVPLVNDKGQTIFWDVATQGKPPEGFVPAGVASTGLRSDSSERTRMYTEAATLIKNDPNNIGKSPEELARLVERYVQTRLGGGAGGTMNAADREAVRRALLGTQ